MAPNKTNVGVAVVMACLSIASRHVSTAVTVANTGECPVTGTYANLPITQEEGSFRSPIVEKPPRLLPFEAHRRPQGENVCGVAELAGNADLHLCVLVLVINIRPDERSPIFGLGEEGEGIRP